MWVGGKHIDARFEPGLCLSIHRYQSRLYNLVNSLHLPQRLLMRMKQNNPHKDLSVVSGYSKFSAKDWKFRGSQSNLEQLNPASP